MKPKELTIRSLILGALITTIFTAANVYLAEATEPRITATLSPGRGARF
jgi:uncharacterized oligopeptide transporter (OPT) family protein